MQDVAEKAGEIDLLINNAEINVLESFISDYF
jgi:hypothetical protein